MFRWVQRRRREPEDVSTFGAASLEEEHWRRKMILAARKLQEAQRALTSDLEQIGGLGEILRSSEARIEELTAGLAETHGVVEGLGERLEQHAGLLRSSGRPAPLDPEDDTAELFAQSEAAVVRLVERIRELREQHGTPQHDARDQELARIVTEQEQRIARLEEERRRLEQELLAVPSPEPADTGRSSALADEVRRLEMEKVELETRHVEQMIELADQTRTRIRELEGEVARRGDRLRHLETMFAMAQEEAEAPGETPTQSDQEEPVQGPWAEPAFGAPDPPPVGPDGLIESDLFLDELENYR